MQIIDGRMLADRLAAKAAGEVLHLKRTLDIEPCLAVILVGDDPASEIYVRRKLIACRKAGLRSIEHRMPSTTGQHELLMLIERLNRDDAVHGILVQLPLPPHIDPTAVLDTIDPGKDVDGFHPVNVGRLSVGSGGLVPCTPLGCMLLLESVIDEFRGLNAVVIGKSNIVGKPVALLLLERECTVTVTHIATRGLPAIVRAADIVVVAAGSPHLVKGDWVKPGAVVIDVGINRLAGAHGRNVIVGDAALAEMEHVLAITPVPGGVGPMTVACLISNTVRAASGMLDTR